MRRLWGNFDEKCILTKPKGNLREVESKFKENERKSHKKLKKNWRQPEGSYLNEVGEISEMYEKNLRNIRAIAFYWKFF